MSVIVVLCECIAPFLVTVAAPYPQKVRLLFSTPTSGVESSTYSPWHIDLTTAAAVSDLPSARQPVFSAIAQSFEGTSDPLNIQKRHLHMISYCFDLHGLSLDPASLESEN